MISSKVIITDTLTIAKEQLVYGIFYKIKNFISSPIRNRNLQKISINKYDLNHKTITYLVVGNQNIFVILKKGGKE